MNIFAVDKCPKISAINLCNRHIVKMPLESCGMLVFCFPEGSTPIENKYSNRHYKHPASVWVRESKSNFEWLLDHTFYQLEEYKSRYHREHSYLPIAEWVKKHKHSLSFDKIELTDNPRCFLDYKLILTKERFPDTVLSYRRFYRLDKSEFAKWPSVEAIPDWWIEKTEKFVDKTFVNGQYTKR